MEVLPVSVVVVARNAGSTIEECLVSVQRNNPAEIIVVDGNSTDRTVEIARGYTERIYSDEGKGQGYARQLGAEKATQEYVTYVDSDVILTEHALATMLAEFQGSEYISIHAQVSPDTKCSNYWERAQLEHYLIPRRDHIGMLTCIFQRETILKYKFDLSAEHLDDFSLEFKLKKEGYRFGTSSALVYHHWKETLKSFVAHRFLLGRYKPRAIRKYGLWNVGFWAPAVTVYWLTFCLIKGKLSLIPYFIVDGVAETAGMIKGFIEIMGGKDNAK